jgi:Rrf2 family protein
MLSRQASHALKALLELAQAPEEWRSTPGLANAQQLPEPMLEQLLLRMRRSGLLVARRGRLGGYRLASPARQISVAAVLAALGESALGASEAHGASDSASNQVTRALHLRLERARQRALAELSLEDLLFDLRSAEASRNSDAGLLIG